MRFCILTENYIELQRIIGTMCVTSFQQTYRWDVNGLRQFCCMVLVALGFCAPLLHAQDAASSKGLLAKQAQDEFSAGDYAKAAATITTIIKTSNAVMATWLDKTPTKPALPTQQWLEPFFYLLGASYFNAKDWPNAIAIFNKYLVLYPKSFRLSQITFSLAQANLLGGHPDVAAPLFSSLLVLPDYHVKAFMLLIEATTKMGKPADAITLIEKEKTTANLSPVFLEKMNTRLFPLYLDAGSMDKGVSLLHEMDADIDHVQDVTIFNALAIRLGQMFLPKNDVASALDCYRRVRDNEQILTLQAKQITSLQQQRAANLASIQANPLNSFQLQLDNKDIDAQIDKDQQILDKYQTLPPVLPPLFLRIAQAYNAAGAQWEAAVVYREILRRYPKCDQAESALYGSIVLFDRLKQTDRAQALCQAYQTEYPKGKYIDDVGFLRGALSYDVEDFDKAISYFQQAIKNQPNSTQREHIEIILGDINLREMKFDDAIACYQKYLKDYPQGRWVEAAEYRPALALLFGGKFDDAEKAIKAYLKKYAPAADANTKGFGTTGVYVPDAEYRLAMIDFAGKDYDKTIADCLAWEKKHGTVPPQAEVLSLLGDCYASLNNRDDDAVSTYILSYKAAAKIAAQAAAHTAGKPPDQPEVLNYSLFAAAKLLQKQAKWEDIASMFQEFIKDNPDSPTVVSAVSWIGRADIKLGKVDEGKQFMATTAKQYLNDPSREAVDEIITQLAQLFARKHVNYAAATASATPPSAATTSDTPTLQSLIDADPAQALVETLTIPDLVDKDTARSRLLFAKAELARLQRKPDAETQILLSIAQQFKPEDLSPIVLGQVGDSVLQGGHDDQATPFYNQLMDAYNDSPEVDYAYNGLAQIAYRQKDYQKADRYYSKALDKGLAASKLKDITLGEAQTLLALSRPTDAKPLFEQVAGTRAWRGEATALSVLSLGDIQAAFARAAEQKGQIQQAQSYYAAANAYYQRVFVAYQKYPAIQAKAYLGSGEAFEKLVKFPEAVNTYSEMLKNPNLTSLPEATEAKQRLANLTQK